MLMERSVVILDNPAVEMNPPVCALQAGANLALMREIDELAMEGPLRGTRRICAAPKRRVQSCS